MPFARNAKHFAAPQMKRDALPYKKTKPMAFFRNRLRRTRSEHNNHKCFENEVSMCDPVWVGAVQIRFPLRHGELVSPEWGFIFLLLVRLRRSRVARLEA